MAVNRAIKQKHVEDVREEVPVGLVTRQKLVRINLNVPPATRRAWKAEANAADKSLQDLIVEGMNFYFSAQMSKGEPNPEGADKAASSA